MQSTNNGKKGGLLKGKPHYDKDGKPLGGIKAVVGDTNQPVELEGGEVIINKEASKKYWKELSKINQSAGGGLPIQPPSGADDYDGGDDFEKGGKIRFNPNKLPTKKVYGYAKKIQEKYPKVWDMGGNIFGNEAYKNLERALNRGYWLDSENWMYVKWQSFNARHSGDIRIAGIIANLKWLNVVDKGWEYMKDIIQAEIDKKYGSNKMKKGGVVTYKNKYNAKYDYSNDESHILKEIAKDTFKSVKGLQQIYNKGIGAYKTNPQSVRPNVTSKEQWAMARVYSAVMGGKASKIDSNELKMERGGITGDVFSMANKEQFKQVMSLTNDLVENNFANDCFISNNDNSVIFLTGKIVNDDKKNQIYNFVSKTIKQRYNVFNTNKSFSGKSVNWIYSDKELQGFKVYFQNEIVYQKGGSVNQTIICENCGWIWNTKDSAEFDKYICHKCNFNNDGFYSKNINNDNANCINFIKKSDVLKNNGYLYYFKNTSVYCESGQNSPNVKSFYLVTYNSGGQKNLKVTDTVNAIKLSNELQKVIGCNKSVARILLNEFFSKSKKIDINNLPNLKGEKIIIADRDIIDCTNIKFEKDEQKFSSGGTFPSAVFEIKTPTGVASKLSYMQQVLVRTTSFKKWFGDWQTSAKEFLKDKNKDNFYNQYKNISLNIDFETLEPRVVFHGTRVEDEFYVFDTVGKHGRPYGYFAYNKSYSENFVQNNGSTVGNKFNGIYEVFLNTKNPLMMNGKLFTDKKYDGANWVFYIALQTIMAKFPNEKADPVNNKKHANIVNDVVLKIGSYIMQVDSQMGLPFPFWRLMAYDLDGKFKAFIQSYDFDSVIYTEEIGGTYDVNIPNTFTIASTIFKPEQVKLADGRNVNFDEKNPDIRYKKGGELLGKKNNLKISHHFNQITSSILGKKYENGGIINKYEQTIKGDEQNFLEKTLISNRKIVNNLLQNIKK